MSLRPRYLCIYVFRPSEYQIPKLRSTLDPAAVRCEHGRPRNAVSQQTALDDGPEVDTTMRRFRLAFLLSGVLIASVARAESVSILVNKPDRVNVRSWPVTLGVPFSQGRLRDAAGLCVVDREGRSVPAQIATVGTWPDGSVRWAHVDFDAKFPNGYSLDLNRPAAPDPRTDVRVQQSALTEVARPVVTVMPRADC